jgi:hypothetical protein
MKWNSLKCKREICHDFIYAEIWEMLEPLNYLPRRCYFCGSELLVYSKERICSHCEGGMLLTHENGRDVICLFYEREDGILLIWEG